MKTLKTYKAEIWIGRKHGYDGEIYPLSTIKDICQEFVEKGACVTVTETDFIYTGGNEPGACIGMINYPRFPQSEHDIYMDAVELAGILMKRLSQYRCTIVTTDETFMLENDDMEME